MKSFATTGPTIRTAIAIARALGAIVCVTTLFAILDFAVHGADASFWTIKNLQTISVQNAFVVIAALGMLLVIISGGIDLSAGMALALCATIVAWAMREDIGFVVSHGDNVDGAVRQLRAADDLLHRKPSQPEAPGDDQTQKNAQAARQKLLGFLQTKLEQVQSSANDAANGNATSRQNQLAEIQTAIKSTEDANVSIEADPSWLRFIPNAPTSAALALAMGLVSGALCGLLNGVLIVALRVVPFIATLGTMTIYLGLAKVVADETAVRPAPIQVPEWLGELSAVRPDPSWLLVSKGVWLALLLAAVIACVLRYSVFGRYVFAIGSSESTARLCGINVPAVKITVYTLSGLLIGIASICFFARLNSGNPTSGTGLELKFIAAVVIGGASLNGGRGTVLGTLAGTAIMGVIASGCTLLGMRNPYQDIILGSIIIAAVTIDQLRQRSR